MAKTKSNLTAQDREKIKRAEDAQEAAQDALYRFVADTVVSGFARTARAQKKWDSDFWKVVIGVESAAMENLAANLEPGLRKKGVEAFTLGMARAGEAKRHAA